MKDKTQKMVSYVSAYGINVYETVQYNKKADAWYRVGDSSTVEEYIRLSIELHNKTL